MTFSERLNQIREDHDYSQQDLAETLHLTPGALSHYEKGTREPNIQTLVQIAQYLNVSVDYLLGCSDVDLKPSLIQKKYVIDLELKNVIERLLKLDAEHRKLIVSVLKCIETDQYVSDNRKRK